MMKQKGDLYPVWVLNHTNTEIMLSNRVAMGRGYRTTALSGCPSSTCFCFR